MPGVVKNMMVRVGADMSGLIGEFKRSGKATGNFAKQASDALREVALSDANLKKSMAQGGKNSYIVSLTDQIRELEQEQKALQAAGFSWGYEGFENNAALLKELKSELDMYKKSLDSAEISERAHRQALEEKMLAAGSDERIVSLTASIKALTEEQRQLKAMGFSWGFEGFEQNEALLRKLKNELNEYIESLRETEEETEDVVKDTKHLGNASKNNIESFAKAIKRLGIVSLGLRFVRSTFGELGSIVRQYISENEALQAQVDTLKSSMGQALAPAINIVTNALSRLMPYIVGVSNAISSLISNLFGSGWTNLASDANAATKAISGAGGAASALNRQLHGFDEITKLNDKNGGGGSLASSAAAIEGKLPEWATSLTDMIKLSIETGDWESVGKTLAEKLVQLITALDWMSLFKKLPSLQEQLTTFFKGWFSGISLESIGESLKTNIASFFENLDFGSILKTGLKSIMGANPVANAAVEAMFGNMKEYFAPYIDSLSGELETVGEEIFLGVLMGIADAVLNVGKWLKEYVLHPMVEGFKQAFDIHSPAAHPEIRSIGKNIILGVFEGILEIAKSPLEWIKTNVFTPIQQAMQTLFDGNVMAKFTVSVRNTSSTWWSNVKTWWSQKVTQPVQAFTTSVKNESSVWWSNVKAWWEEAKGTLLMNAFVRDESKTWWENVKKWWNANVGTLSVGVAIINNSKKWWEDVKKWWNENVGTLLAPFGFGTLNSSGSSQQLNSGARSSEASLSLGDGSALAGRVAAQMLSSTPADNRNITVNLVLDGKIVTSTVVRNINSQARATGHNPLSAYL